MTTTTISTGTALTSAWEEAPQYGDRAPLPRVARADCRFTYEGDLTGTGECRYVFRYGPDGSCQVLGFEQVSGALAGREGEFFLSHEGTFGASGLSVRSTIVPGSATGDLEGLTGAGTLDAGPGEESCRWTLEHSQP